ncbi:photosystem I reaction center subunit VIII [Scytonema sp. UIC 10036]|nr:photosystem I reaction center subunit VIII [Scytonema sp. UIC 10036]MUG97618.1 photosystem I reaction center subunit VIII [Scytonema sp. UIC 10036]
MYSASYLSAIFVPLTGFLIPAVVSAFMLLYIERDDIG